MEQYIGKKVDGVIHDIEGFVGIVVDAGVDGEDDGKFNFEDKWCQVEFLELSTDKGDDWRSKSAREQKLNLFRGYSEKLTLVNGSLHSRGTTMKFREEE